MAITYNRTNWQNKVTPVNATNMNNIEQGIVDCAEALNAATVDDALSATSENPVQNKVIYNALGEKLDIIPISLSSTTTEERRTEFLTTIRSHFTESNEIKLFFLTSPTSIKFEAHYDAAVGVPEYDLTAMFAGLISVMYFASNGQMVLQGLAVSVPYMIVDASNNVSLITPNPLPTISYSIEQTYRPVALGTMKLYVADAPDTISAVADNACTFDFSKGQMLTANIDMSADTTLTFGVTGNNDVKYVGRTISACITNTSTSTARTITFEPGTGMTIAVGVEGGSADSLSVPALKTVKLNATLLKNAAGFVVYIEYKQIN